MIATPPQSIIETRQKPKVKNGIFHTGAVGKNQEDRCPKIVQKVSESRNNSITLTASAGRKTRDGKE